MDTDFVGLINPGNATNDAGEATSVAIDVTLEERGTRYGSFETHANVSRSLMLTLESHIMSRPPEEWAQFLPIHREAMVMICHKLARIVNGDPNYDDSWRDIAGYATLVEKYINGEGV